MKTSRLRSMFMDMEHVICQMRVQLVIYLYIMSMTASGLELRMVMRPDDDQFLLTGSSLHLNCSLIIVDSMSWESGMHSYMYNVSDIKIFKFDGILSNHRLTYHEQDLTLEMSIENVSIYNSGFYGCVYAQNNSVYTLIKINVGGPPGKPSNLTCISNNYVSLTCFAILAEPTTYLSMNWTMQFRYAGLCKTQWKNIPWTSIPQSNCMLSEDDANVSCSWNNINQQPGNMAFSRFECHQIRVGVETWYGTNWSQHLTFMPADKVKPDPVHSLEIHHTHNSTSMKLRWSSADLALIIHLKYRLRIISEENWDVRTLVYKPTSKNKVSESYMLTNLIPFVNYTIMIYAQPVAAHEEIYWSQGTQMVFTTSDDVPGMPPIMTQGSFITLDCSELNMCLVFYWKNPPRRYWHGIDSYRVKVDPDVITVTNISYRVYYRLEQKLAKGDHYTITMWLMTRKGCSANHTELIVPSWLTATAMKPLWVAVEMASYGVSVSWMVDRKICASITSVTYYWCAAELLDINNATVFGCKNELDWYTTNETNACTQPIHHGFNGTGSQSSIQYAVSIIVNDVSGGMVWERYRFTKSSAAPMMPLYAVTSSSGSQLQITILFEAYYTSTGGCPESYLILYDTFSTSTDKHCPKDCNNKSFLASFTNPVMTLDDLMPDTQYVVCVQAINKAGKGQMGNAVIGITSGTKGSVQKAQIIGIAIPTIILFMVVFIGIVYFLKKAITDRISTIDNINMPLIYETVQECKTMNNSFVGNVPEGLHKKNLDADNYKNSSPSSSAKIQLVEQLDTTTLNPESVIFRSNNSMLGNLHAALNLVCVTSRGNKFGIDDCHDVFDIGNVTFQGRNDCHGNSHDTFIPESVTFIGQTTDLDNSPDCQVIWKDDEQCKEISNFTACQMSAEQDSCSKLSKIPNTPKINNNINNDGNMCNDSMYTEEYVPATKPDTKIIPDYVLSTAIGNR